VIFPPAGEISKRSAAASTCAISGSHDSENTIRNEEDYRRHVDYIYINPLKHGYVGKVSDWPYSTFHRDVAEGLYPVDWAGEIEDLPRGSGSESRVAATPYPAYKSSIP
jgi:putative transposase